jgi:hypothetical protein
MAMITVTWATGINSSAPPPGYQLNLALSRAEPRPWPEDGEGLSPRQKGEVVSGASARRGSRRPQLTLSGNGAHSTSDSCL